MPGQTSKSRKTRKALRTFRVRDLLITVLPGRSVSGGTSIPVDDGPPLPPEITIVAATALVARKVRAFQKLAVQVERLDLAVMDRFAQEIGWDVIASNMRCVEDAPTCRAMPPWVSRVASVGLDTGLTLDHLVSLRPELEAALAGIVKLEEESLVQARLNPDIATSVRSGLEDFQAG